ncbi:MAG: hypothetical protein ACI4M3_09030 [Acutalibacteraceae bacterium]
MSRDIFQYYEKNVKMLCKDGLVLTGLIADYIPTGDIESIEIIG